MTILAFRISLEQLGQYINTSSTQERKGTSIVRRRHSRVEQRFQRYSVLVDKEGSISPRDKGEMQNGIKIRT